MKQKLIKVGNSLMVVVPAGFVRIVGAKAKDKVEIETDPTKGVLKVKFSAISQLLLGEQFFKK